MGLERGEDGSAPDPAQVLQQDNRTETGDLAGDYGNLRQRTEDSFTVQLFAGH
jgi:hypothetical protein